MIYKTASSNTKLTLQYAIGSFGNHLAVNTVYIGDSKKIIKVNVFTADPLYGILLCRLHRFCFIEWMAEQSIQLHSETHDTRK